MKKHIKIMEKQSQEFKIEIENENNNYEKFRKEIIKGKNNAIN